MVSGFSSSPGWRYYFFLFFFLVGMFFFYMDYGAWRPFFALVWVFFFFFLSRLFPFSHWFTSWYVESVAEVRLLRVVRDSTVDRRSLGLVFLVFWLIVSFSGRSLRGGEVWILEALLVSLLFPSQSTRVSFCHFGRTSRVRAELLDPPSYFSLARTLYLLRLVLRVPSCLLVPLLSSQHPRFLLFLLTRLSFFLSSC
ncbi:hypothetical protein BJ508DRAFT_75278 [Ascobolus immersus RN42]|uniref:Uncharacterized protein n=1 Tax=Ascobolus immersus RN42 TaxID=1160509 RepID=A0A3N4IAX5_ASCIM|nr:hypothetical protein BJ508DRAFT_75278 [Ascobolus immersus RN42]